MSALNPRHPLPGRVIARWAIVPALEEDELLSSWLIRTALAQGCDPLVLTGHLWPKWRIWTLDADRGLPADRLTRLAAASGVDEARLDAASLRVLNERLQPNSTSSAIWPWLLALGSRNRRRYGGLQYCPRCFAEDVTPYFRRAWRMAWHTTCAVHEEGLRDRCHACNAVPEPHRMVAGDGCIDRCATCRADLKEASPLSADLDALAFQNMADQVLQAGAGQFGGSPLVASAWFSLAHFLITLIRRVVAMQPQGLGEFLSQLSTRPLDIPFPTNAQLAIELLPVATRTALFRPLPELLEAGSVRMLTAAQGAHLTAASFASLRQRIPEALHPFLSGLPTGNQGERRSPRKPSLAPRSPAAVLRHCVRMHRRFARS